MYVLIVLITFLLLLLFPCSTSRRASPVAASKSNAKFDSISSDTSERSWSENDYEEERESDREQYDNTTDENAEQTSDEEYSTDTDDTSVEDEKEDEKEHDKETDEFDRSVDTTKFDENDDVDEMALDALRKELLEMTERLRRTEDQLNRVIYAQNDISTKKLQVAVRPMNGSVRTEFFHTSLHVPLYEELLFLINYHVRDTRFSKHTTALGDSDVFKPREYWNRFSYVNVHAKKPSQYVCWGVALTLAFNFQFLDHVVDFYENDDCAYGFSTVIGRIENRYVAFVSVLLEVNADRERLIECCRALNDRLKPLNGVQVVMGGIFGMSPTQFDQLIFSAECDVLHNASMHTYNQATYWDSSRKVFAPYIFVRTNNAQITQTPTVLSISNHAPHTFLQGCEVNVRVRHLLNQNMGDPMRVVED